MSPRLLVALSSSLLIVTACSKPPAKAPAAAPAPPTTPVATPAPAPEAPAATPVPAPEAPAAAPATAPGTPTPTKAAPGKHVAVVAPPVGLVRGPASAPIAPAPSIVPVAVAPDAQPAPAPFSGLTKQPLTLHYDVNGVAVACQLEDAGVPGTSSDFTVVCTPAEAPWSCLAGSYFGDMGSRSAPSLWRSAAGGCYSARPDGLWYFVACPAGDGAAAKVDDPASSGAVRMLSAKMLLPGHVDADDAKRGVSNEKRSLEVDGKAVDVACATAGDAGMSKSASRTTCSSPRWGYVATDSSYDEAGKPVCADKSALVAVAAGLEPPRASKR